MVEQDKDMVEQDTARRVPYGVWIHETEGAAPSFYLAHGLGPNGLRLKAKHPPRTGQPLSMRLLVENERRVMALQGEVVPDGCESFAVRFVNLDPDDQALLDELVAEST